MTRRFESQRVLLFKRTYAFSCSLVLLLSIFLLVGGGPSSSDFEKSQSEIGLVKSALDEINKRQEAVGVTQKELSSRLNALRSKVPALANQIGENKANAKTTRALAVQP
jgi:hypothetical protein